jgi:hypothetical protein
MPQEPSAEEAGPWHRRFAAESNSLAWTLSEKSARTAAEDAEMLRAAYAASFHWSKVGTESNRARADMLLGHVHALLKQGAPAMHHARRSYDYVTAHESPEWEVAFANAILAHAAHAAKDVGAYSHHYPVARQLGEALADPEERELFERTFARIPSRPEVMEG